MAMTKQLEVFLSKGYEIYEMLEITTNIKRVELWEINVNHK